MLRVETVTSDEIIQYIKLSCQIPSVSREVIIRKLIVETAAKLGITVEVEELQQAADSFRVANHLLQAEATWNWLQTHCLSLDEFEDIIYANVLSSKLAQHLFGDRVEPFFVEHQLDYTAAVIYEIILDDADLALELFYAIQEQEISYAEVAYQYIQDIELRRVGGYRGQVSRSELKPDISAAVFAASPPQVLKPIVTSKGVHLIKVEELIHPELTEALQLTILADLFMAWVNQQLEQVEIVTTLEPTTSAVPTGLISNGNALAKETA